MTQKACTNSHLRTTVTPRPSTTPASAQTTSPPTPPSTPRLSLTTSVPNGAPSVSQDAMVTPTASTTAEPNTLAVLRTPLASTLHPPLPRQQPQRLVPAKANPQTLPARPSTLVLVVVVLLKPAPAAPRLAQLLLSSSARLTACSPSLLVSSVALLFFCKRSFAPRFSTCSLSTSPSSTFAQYLTLFL